MRDNTLGKLPPQAVDIEETTLGALMLEKDALDVLDILQPSDFYDQRHGIIYSAVQSLFVEGVPVDMRTVVTRLKKMGKIEHIGGMHYIAELTSKVSQASNIEAHARIIRELSIKRNIIALAASILDRAYSDTSDAFELVDHIQTCIIADSIHGESTVKSPGKAYQEYIESLQARKDQEVTGIKSGFTRIDRITSGWQNTELVIIAARPGMGKTAFMLACAENAGVPVDIYSLEMGAMQLTQRRVSSAYEIDNYNLKRGRLEESDWARIVNDASKISSKPIYIDDSSGLSITDLRIRSIRNKKKHSTGLIIVDYLQLMKGVGHNREQEISSISRGLKALAKDLNIPVIALSQLSRAVETRGGDKRPLLSDLRESGAIEQDADIVSFLYRPEYYGITADENGMSTIGKAEFIIAKNRGGNTEAVWIDFTAKFTKFLELDQLRTDPPAWTPYKDDESPF
jgi:replicative DNA helicase